MATFIPVHISGGNESSFLRHFLTTIVLQVSVTICKALICEHLCSLTFKFLNTIIIAYIHDHLKAPFGSFELLFLLEIPTKRHFDNTKTSKRQI